MSPSIFIDFINKSYPHSEIIQDIRAFCGKRLYLDTENVFRVDGCCSDDFHFELCSMVYFDKPNGYMDKNYKFDRMKREILALALNSNRDPLQNGGSTLRIATFFADQSPVSGGDQPQPNNNQDSEQHEFSNDSWREIHQRYRYVLGKFDEVIMNGFEGTTDSKLVFKHRLVVGTGPVVDATSVVVYNCAFWLEGAPEPYDSTWLRRNTLVTDLSSDTIMPGLRELLCTTRKGEWTEALIRPNGAFGLAGWPPRIPKNVTIFCLLEVVDIVTCCLDPIEQGARAGGRGLGPSFEDFYEAGEEARRRGKYYHRTEQYRVAVRRYVTGIRILEALDHRDERKAKKTHRLLVKLYNNLAKAANAAGYPRLALNTCKQAFVLDELNSKTFWNRMTAWKLLNRYDNAAVIAKRAIQLFNCYPQTKKSFQLELNQIKQKLQNDLSSL